MHCGNLSAAAAAIPAVVVPSAGAATLGLVALVAIVGAFFVAWAVTGTENFANASVGCCVFGIWYLVGAWFVLGVLAAGGLVVGGIASLAVSGVLTLVDGITLSLAPFLAWLPGRSRVAPAVTWPEYLGLSVASGLGPFALGGLLTAFLVTLSATCQFICLGACVAREISTYAGLFGGRANSSRNGAVPVGVELTGVAGIALMGLAIPIPLVGAATGRVLQTVVGTLVVAENVVDQDSGE
jgi:hypothetical protein